MNDMKRSTKIWLGAATLWPVLYMFLFFAFVLGMMILAPQPSGGDSVTLPPEFGIAIIGIFFLHFVTIFMMLGLMVYYIVHAVKNESLNTDMRAVWAVLFFFMGMFAQPIYWYLYIWKSSVPEKPAQLNATATSAWKETRSDRSEPVQVEPHSWR